jgi:prepilin-type N-terminal cleavage/methylation domain-containing protein
MYKSLRKRTEGFTIIEVLIVLAIAGLIMLIVFLAVPALQRNSRNTQRTEDVGRILGAAQEVLNNNNGQLTSLTSANVRTAAGANLSYYTQANIAVTAGAAGAAGDTDQVRVHTAARCNGSTVEDGTTRQLAATFRVETGSGEAVRCQAS